MHRGGIVPSCGRSWMLLNCHVNRRFFTSIDVTQNLTLHSLLHSCRARLFPIAYLAPWSRIPMELERGKAYETNAIQWLLHDKPAPSYSHPPKSGCQATKQPLKFSWISYRQQSFPAYPVRFNVIIFHSSCLLPFPPR